MQSIRTNQFFLLRTLWGSLRHADWRGAQSRYGPFGVVIEFVRALAGFSAWPVFIPAQAGWEPDAVRTLLDGHGIANWGWGYDDGDYFCQVPMRQAHWTQYLLQQNGVPLGGQLLDDNGARAPQPARSKPAVKTPARNGMSPAQNRSKRRTPRGPIRTIHAMVDRLADW